MDQDGIVAASRYDRIILVACQIVSTVCVDYILIGLCPKKWEESFPSFLSNHYGLPWYKALLEALGELPDWYKSKAIHIYLSAMGSNRPMQQNKWTQVWHYKWQWSETSGRNFQPSWALHCRHGNIYRILLWRSVKLLWLINIMFIHLHFKSGCDWDWKLELEPFGLTAIWFAADMLEITVSTHTGAAAWFGVHHSYWRHCDLHSSPQPPLLSLLPLVPLLPILPSPESLPTPLSRLGCLWRDCGGEWEFELASADQY